MTILQAEGSEGLLSEAFSRLKDTLKGHGSSPDAETEMALKSVLEMMARLLAGDAPFPVYHLASLDPGSGKTEALCAFLSAWKASGFVPSGGALIVLATRKEIEHCIARSGLQPTEFAVLVQKDHPMNDLGSPSPDRAPILFTTQEKLRRECGGWSFADASAFHYHGRPRSLRVWDEAFLPATPVTVRKDTMLQPLEALRPLAPAAAASLESFSDSLSADRAGEAVHVPGSALGVLRALRSHLGHGAAERLTGLAALAGTGAVIVNGGGQGLHLAGAHQRLPADFAPALILDASGRVRETYRTIEKAGLLKRLPSGTRDYAALRVHLWERAASRSALSDPETRREVLEAAAGVINDGDQAEPWLVIHAQDRAAAGYSVIEELGALVTNPGRLSFVHWGNHHGTNDYRHIGKVLVLGLWQYPQPVYAALHLAAGGDAAEATERATQDALKAGEHCHHLLQAICRASVRQGRVCAVYLVGKLGPEAGELLQATFPGAQVEEWCPAGHELKGTALRVSLELERLLGAPGVQRVQKGDLRASLGFRTGEALAKVIRRGDFRTWMAQRGLEATTRAIERKAA